MPDKSPGRNGFLALCETLPFFRCFSAIVRNLRFLRVLRIFFAWQSAYRSIALLASDQVFL